MSISVIRSRLLALLFVLTLTIAIVPVAQSQQSCPVNAVSVDDTNWQGAVVAQVYGTGCNVVIEIINTRPYWVNLRLTPVGNGLQVTPEGAQSANLFGYRVLPPLGSIRLAVTFTAPGQSIMALLDGSAAIDTGAREMTMVQALVDLFSLVGVIDSTLPLDFLINYYPTLRNAVVTAPNLQAAMISLANGNWNAFRRSMEGALAQGELEAFRSVLVNIGVTVLINRLDNLVVSRIPIANALQVIYTNYSAVLARLIAEPAGFIILTAEGSTSGTTDLTGRAIAIGESAGGTLIAGQRDTWQLNAAGGETVRINMDADFDTYLELYAPDGVLVAQNDDFNGLNAQITATLPNAGTYTIIARAYADRSGGTYALRVSAVGSSNPAPAVGAVTRNANWTPVMQEFDGVPMVLVPPGCFMMGMTQAEIDDLIRQYPGPEERIRTMGPQHRQCFDAPFWIDQTEVTLAQFISFGEVVEDMEFIALVRGLASVLGQHPIESITWLEARDFCTLRGARLPTEAEWEYAARGPDGLAYPWGNTFIANNAVWDRDVGGIMLMSETTQDVGSFPTGRSWVGALDMAGNVMEWTSSLYWSYPYDSNDGREVDTNTRANIEHRVVRGGSWMSDDPYELHVAFRDREYSNIRVSSGFRCARSS
ncbi:MAG: SUMF1/EgtB/PvdO family nonheme iron enzyme [Candidatus Flexifilum sp.]|nr:MAG: hypothetical protein CUN53_06600 [Phototrophicales bacterium]